MALGTEKVAETFLSISTGVPIDCNWPLYAEDEVVVVYGSTSLEATLNVDYTVALDAPNYDQFTITPLAALLTKINNLIAADPTETNFITVRRKLDYLTSVQPETVRYTAFLSREIERIHMRFQQLAEEIYRAVVVPAKVTGTTAVRYFIDPPVANRGLVWDSTGTKLTNGPDLTDLTSFEAVASDAVASTSANATTATTQAGIATTKAVEAATSAAQAQLALDGIPYRDTVFLTVSDSPKTLTNSDRGTLFVCDTSGGNIVINLAAIAGLTMPHTIGVKKHTSDANMVTINRGGTDQIDSGTSYSIATVAGVNLIADTDPTPDRWTSVAFGAGSGEVRTQTFTAGVDFIAGLSTQVTLTNAPVSPSSTALEVFYDGVAQHPSEWTYNPGTGVVAFNEAIPSDVAQIYTRWASSSVIIGTPSTGSTGLAQLTSALQSFLLAKDRVISGLTINNNGTDATNDIDVQPGSCVSDDGTEIMTLSAVTTKQLDAAWAVGSAQGGRDTGAIADAYWHVWVIKRLDTGVVDVLLSQSASAPTMPPNYTKKKCIGTIVRASATILAFLQNRNTFEYVTSRITTATVGTSRTLMTLLCPPNVEAIFRAGASAASGNYALFQSTSETDAAPSSSAVPGCTLAWAAGIQAACDMRMRVDGSSQIAVRSGVASTFMQATVRGWVDYRI